MWDSMGNSTFYWEFDVNWLKNKENIKFGFPQKSSLTAKCTSCVFILKQIQIKEIILMHSTVYACLPI